MAPLPFTDQAYTKRELDEADKSLAEYARPLGLHSIAWESHDAKR